MYAPPTETENLVTPVHTVRVCRKTLSFSSPTSLGMGARSLLSRVLQKYKSAYVTVMKCGTKQQQQQKNRLESKSIHCTMKSIRMKLECLYN